MIKKVHRAAPQFIHTEPRTSQTLVTPPPGVETHIVLESPKRAKAKPKQRPTKTVIINAACDFCPSFAALANHKPQPAHFRNREPPVHFCLFLSFQTDPQPTQRIVSTNRQYAQEQGKGRQEQA